MSKVSSTSNDTRLVEECLSGNDEAWSALVEKYKRLVYSIALRYQATPDDAADIFQAVCLELFSELAKLRKSESLRSWLMTVTTHKCLHWKRKKEPLAEGEPDDLLRGIPADGTWSVGFEELEREQALREAVAELPPRCQEMIRLLFYEMPPLPYAEVAQRLGLATGSIGFIRGRCLKKLQQRLEKMGF
jgi:RNA polymerase sigma factor (sigma-70 family)